MALQNSAAVAWVRGDGPQSIQFQAINHLGELDGPPVNLGTTINLNQNPFSLSPGPPQTTHSIRQWFAMVTAEALSSDLTRDPELLRLRFFTAEGRPICFSE